jgi:hypothetical protein
MEHGNDRLPRSASPPVVCPAAMTGSYRLVPGPGRHWEIDGDSAVAHCECQYFLSALLSAMGRELCALPRSWWRLS